MDKHGRTGTGGVRRLFFSGRAAEAGAGSSIEAPRSGLVEPDDGVPAGWVKVPASVYMRGRDVVVTYEPPEAAEGEGHNCDAMGCGQEHVLLRATIVEFV